jgi:hypothetical protein
VGARRQPMSALSDSLDRVASAEARDDLRRVAD